MCLITFDSFHCDSFEPVPDENTLWQKTHLDSLPRGRNPPGSAAAGRGCGEVRDAGTRLISAAAGEMGESVEGRI